MRFVGKHKGPFEKLRIHLKKEERVGVGEKK